MMLAARLTAQKAQNHPGSPSGAASNASRSSRKLLRRFPIASHHRTHLTPQINQPFSRFVPAFLPGLVFLKGPLLFLPGFTVHAPKVRRNIRLRQRKHFGRFLQPVRKLCDIPDPGKIGAFQDTRGLLLICCVYPPGSSGFLSNPGNPSRILLHLPNLLNRKMQTPQARNHHQLLRVGCAVIAVFAAIPPLCARLDQGSFLVKADCALRQSRQRTDFLDFHVSLLLPHSKGCLNRQSTGKFAEKWRGRRGSAAILSCCKEKQRSTRRFSNECSTENLSDTP